MCVCVCAQVPRKQIASSTGSCSSDFQRVLFIISYGCTAMENILPELLGQKNPLTLLPQDLPVQYPPFKEGRYCYAHSVDDETKAQRGKETCPRST